jgi:hypothetical protein
VTRHPRDAEVTDLTRHIGRVVGRENAYAKSRRYLIEGRVIVEAVNSRGVLAKVRGDGRIYTVDYYAGAWSCDCPARSDRCAHLLAVRLVTAVDL